jgi:hypothetical protein
MTRPMQLVFFLSLTVIVVIIIAISFDSRRLSSPIRSPAWLGVLLPGTGAPGAFPKPFPPDYLPYRCGWSPTFFDDFNGNSLDYTMWSTNYPAGERERQHYTWDALELENGLLQIRADQRQVDDRGMPLASSPPRVCSTSSMGALRSGQKCLPERACGLHSAAAHQQELSPRGWMCSKCWDTNRIRCTSHHWRAEDGSTRIKPTLYRSGFFHRVPQFPPKWSADSLIWRIDGIERPAHTAFSGADVHAGQSGGGWGLAG